MTTINIKISKTPDQDLVQLSGYTIYQYPLKVRFPRLYVNNHWFNITLEGICEEKSNFHIGRIGKGCNKWIGND